MACRKVFWEDPYLTQLEATVTGVHGERITVNQTIAYAFSGGQQSDFGSIGGFEIIKAEKKGHDIEYTLPLGHTLKIGDVVTIQIDWEKRYHLMRLHFAAELVLELVYQNYNHPEKIGANITIDKARVDFFWDGNINRIFPELMDQFKRLVQGNYPISSTFTDANEERRAWEIEGFAKVSCGGTHLKKTGEVGDVSFKRSNIGGGKERIEIYLAN